VFEAQRLKGTAAQKRRAASIALIAGASGAVAAVAVTAAAATSNRDPIASIAFSPPGRPLAHVTLVTFFGNATDPDGDLVTYKWEFGDGTTADGVQRDSVRLGQARLESVAHLAGEAGALLDRLLIEASDLVGGQGTPACRMGLRMRRPTL
jgi:ABC-type glycerol-3-phosphate transport system substrate-binding protein